MTTLAIDIGGTKLAAALIGADGQIRDRRELPTPASQTPEALRDALSALVSPLQAHAQRVAIASTGIIRDGSLLALNPHNLGGLLHFPLVKTLEQLTNLPTIAINDAQAAAWAEFQALDGDITDMVFITVSTGVGGGVVSGCKLLTGPGGLAGHIGHTLADPVSYTHLRAHETGRNLVCRLLLENKKNNYTHLRAPTPRKQENHDLEQVLVHSRKDIHKYQRRT